jgi:cytochrome b pre-mRNA-processing protein 3
MEGRFGLIVAHTFLVLERIRAEGAGGDEIARALLETFMTDMDDNMREIGIGDMGVPRRVKKAAAALHEQIEVYREAASSDSDDALIDAIERYVPLEPTTGDAPALARYIRRAANDLALQPWTGIAGGRVTFPAFPVSA